jgi:hypothetical protein
MHTGDRLIAHSRTACAGSGFGNPSAHRPSSLERGQLIGAAIDDPDVPGHLDGQGLLPELVGAGAG